MSFLRELGADLVEKRLWPLALALVAALVAVPLLLGGGADGTVAASGATGATGTTAGAAAQVTLDVAVPSRRDRSGSVRDPFKQGPAPATGTTAAGGAAATATDSASGAAAASGTTGSSGSGSGSSSAGTAGSSSGGSTATPTPKPLSRDAYAAVLRYGPKGKAAPRRSVLRLTPLPSAEKPSFVYLGVNPGGRSVSFLLSEGVTAKGDGSCRPSKASCETIDLEPGDREELAVTDDAGVVTRSVLVLVRIDTTP